MVEIPKNPKGLVPPNHIPQPDEDELEDMIDLDETLRWVMVMMRIQKILPS
jgi:hypothetical protein